MPEPQPLSLEDYDAVTEAVQATERGRWFLAEYARRIHAADARAVLEALSALEGRLLDRRRQPAAGGVRLVEQVIERAEACRRDFSGEAGRRIAEIERLARAALESLTDPAAGRAAEPPAAAQIAAAVAQAIGVEAPANDPAPTSAAPAAEPPPAAASTDGGSARPRLPKASSPNLLDGLNDAEKAMLLS